MPFDGSGNFTRVMNWVNDAVAGIKIKSDRHDQEDNNFASGLSNTLTKDGQSQPTADIPMNGKRLINVGAPVNPTDAVTKGYTDSIRSFSTAITLTGASPQSRIGFSVADIGFGAREAGAPAGSFNRFVWNDKPDLLGTDIAVLDDTGNMGVAGSYNFNAIQGTGGWVAMKAGFANWMSFNPATGAMAFYATAASVAAGAAAVPVQTASLDKLGNFSTVGSVFVAGSVTATQNFVSSTAAVIMATTGAGNCYLRPNGASNAAGQTYVDSGGTLNVAGNIAATGSVTSFQTFASSFINAILSASGGATYLRPNGAGSGSGEFRIASDGTIYGATNIQIGGSVANKATGTVWGNPSDARIKTVTGDYETGLAEILQLQPRRFTYKGNYTQAAPGLDNSDLEHPVVRGVEAAPYPSSPHYQFAVDATEVAGFIAQEVEAVMPAMVTQGPGYIDGVAVDDFRTLDQSNLILALVNAVKELSARIEALEAAP